MKKNIKEKYAFVNFKYSKIPYIYKCGDLHCKVGNVVEVPVEYSNCTQKAIVKKIKNLSDEQLNFPKEKIKTIHRVLSPIEKKLLLNKKFKMKSLTNKEYVKLWTEKETDYLRTFTCEYTSFTYFFEDGLILFSVREDLGDDDTFASPHEYKYKINLMKSLLVSFYKKEIDENTLLNIIRDIDEAV